jgi:hypothetical protein
MTDYYEQLRKDVETNPGKIVAEMEAKLADNVRILEEGWRSDDRALDAMEMLNELFDVPQPLHVWESCLDICRGFEKIEEGLIAPRYFILLNALIFEATMKGKMQ